MNNLGFNTSLMLLMILLSPLLSVVSVAASTNAAVSKSSTSQVTSDRLHNLSETPPLLLISLDGVRHDYLEKADLPALSRLVTGGLRADSLQQIFPTKTFTTHYSMATGLYADGTGVVANNMWDPNRRSNFSLGNREAIGDGYWYGGEPIWNTLEKAGKKSATYFWPGSEAEIDGIRPSIWMPFDGDTPHDTRIKQVLAWLDQPGDERPDFLTLYFSLIDSAGHDYGPDHPEVIAALKEVDRALGLLIVGLEERGLFNKMHILVTSDHGMEAINAQRYILLDELIDLNKIMVSDWGPAAQIWVTDDGLSADAIFAALNNAHPNLRVWKKADIPPRYHFSKHKRVPDLVAESDLGWMVSSTSVYNRQAERGRPNGMHGWDPAWHSMHGIFIAHGPAFAAGGNIPAVRGIDLYSLIAELLHIKPADNDGNLNAFAPILYQQEPPKVKVSDWRCDTESLVLREGLGSASLQLGQRIFSLPRQQSASGQRYEDTDVLFWSKENQAEVVVDGVPLSNCKRMTA